jgi:hypothetical protein
MLAPVPSVGPGRALHISVQAEEPEAMPVMRKLLSLAALRVVP